MSDINRVNGFMQALPVDYAAPRSSNRFRDAASTALADSPVDDVELSDLGAALGQLSDAPGVRVGRIAKIRAAIMAGTYENNHKLGVVVDKLLDELLR